MRTASFGRTYAVRFAVSTVVERKRGKPLTACREGMVSAAILLDVLENAVADGDGATGAVTVCPIVATELAGGHKRVVIRV